MNETAQQRFDAKYISSLEIQRRLKVNRSSMTFAHQRGTLPAPVTVGGSLHLWEREATEPYIARWEQQLIEVRAKRPQAVSELEHVE